MRVTESIADFSPEELDELTADCLFGKQYLSFVEEEHGSRARVLYFYERDCADGNRLTAFAPAYVYREPIPLTFRLGDFAGGGDAGPFGRWASHLALGVPVRLRSRVFTQDPTATRDFLEQITEWAGQTGLAAVVLPFVLGSDAALRAGLAAAGFASAFYEGDFYLDVSGGDIEEFLTSALARGPRKRFKNDINHFLSSGLTVCDIAELGPDATVLADQHRALMERYNRPAVEFTQESFERFERLVADRRFIGVRSGDDLIGYSMSLYGHGTMHVLRYGRNDEVQDDSRIYINVGYVEPIKRAIELGCGRVHWGKSAHRVKTLRGCRHEDGIVYARFLDKRVHRDLSDVFSRLDVANRERFQALTSGAEPS
ncbi:hypothetical protein [Streptomyces monashensis]|uniref:BioF2-like acetyltransferase domain-containing protein n=1 Tax=Streptomyces monashensis TaxID=1678012 RepID=A0A1S2QQ76_9ACTN|nr:hypothetical protein [Streptomyces monashensis]OIK07777.1 hypothetical protein BIV23_02020 [Streptomyces monashensis]